MEHARPDSGSFVQSAVAIPPRVSSGVWMSFVATTCRDMPLPHLNAFMSASLPLEKSTLQSKREAHKTPCDPTRKTQPCSQILRRHLRQNIASMFNDFRLSLTPRPRPNFRHPARPRKFSSLLVFPRKKDMLSRTSVRIAKTRCYLKKKRNALSRGTDTCRERCIAQAEKPGVRKMT